MHTFFSQHIENDKIILDEEESRHCTKVMRLTIGTSLWVIDGKGNRYTCAIETAGKRVSLDILETKFQSQKSTCVVAVSPTKNADRMEWMTEKMVEIGVQKIAFIQTENSERSRLNLGRIEKKAISALKQSGNLWMPELVADQKLNDFIKTDDSEIKLVAHCYEGQKATIGNIISQKQTTILIGPEGDFSETEIKGLINGGYLPTSLGNSRLRTETAAVVACTLINHFTLI
ncbi:MAG: 16S rRNA (uracil(1498)-N(3))-methyltransferase [Flavobacteriales bacterium]|nr:16S rRNA (uracil(1498)-N(3))-methyltransferase [Flavobacteriales bacterium]